MNAKEETFEEKLQRIQGSQGNIIELNVGGQRLTTTRSTLCQVEGSLLASIFSGCWEDRLKRDKDGAVFFDFNPQYFTPILDYLCARKIASTDNPAPLPTVPKDQLNNFTSLVQHLGLNNEILSSQRVLPGEKFNLHSTNIALQENERVAVHDVNCGKNGYVLGENVYNKGIANLKLKLKSFKDNMCMFVGMVKDDAVTAVPKDNSSHRWSGSYGWTLGSDYIGGVLKDGQVMAENTLDGIYKEGDNVEFVLDCENGILSLHLPTGYRCCIEIPKSESWRLNVVLFYPNDMIRIIES